MNRSWGDPRNDVDRKFEALNKRLNNLSSRFAKLHDDYTQLRCYFARKKMGLKRLDSVAYNADRLNKKLKIVDKFMDNMKEFNSINRRVAEHRHILYLSHGERNRLARLLRVPYAIKKNRVGEWQIMDKSQAKGRGD